MKFQQQKHRKKPDHQRNKRRHGPQKQSASRASPEKAPIVTNDPVFRSFMARQEQIQDETLAAARQAGKHVALALGISLIYQHSWHHCEHIRLSPGVIEMLDDVCYNQEPHNLPDLSSVPLRTPAWIKIEEEQYPPFYEYLGLKYKVRGVFILAPCSEANLALLKQQARFARDRALDHAFAPLRDVVSVHLVGETGAILFDLDFNQVSRRWSFAADHLCPYGECAIGFDLSLKPCERCEMALERFSQWLPICMLALTGWFRQIELEEAESGFSSPLRMQGPDVRNRPPTRMVRTIDVSVRPVRRTDDEGERSSPHASRGSWVERAREQDPDRVKDEERQVPERTRTLKHPRYRAYIEKHGNKVTVKAHTRTVHLLNLPRTTNAQAKRYGDATNQ